MPTSPICTHTSPVCTSKFTYLPFWIHLSVHLISPICTHIGSQIRYCSDFQHAYNLIILIIVIIRFASKFNKAKSLLLLFHRLSYRLISHFQNIALHDVRIHSCNPYEHIFLIFHSGNEPLQ